MSKYTPTLQRVFHTMKQPYPGLIVDVVEYQDYLELRVYKSNIETFSEPQKVALAEYLYQLRDAFRVETKCHIRGVTNDPPRRKR